MQSFLVRHQFESVVFDPYSPLSYVESPYWIVFEMLGIQICVFIVACINETWHCYWSWAPELREWYKSCKPDRCNWTTALILLVKLPHRCSMRFTSCLGFYKSGLVKDYNFRDIFEPHIWLFRMLNSIVEVCSVFSVFLSQTLFIIDDIVQPKKIQTSKPVWLLFFCGKLGENEHNIWAVVMYHKYLTSCPYDLCTKSYEDIQWICVRNMRK